MKHNDLRQVLVLVDGQIDFIRGSLANYKGEEVLANMVDVIREYREEYGENLYIYVTRDTHYSDYLDTLEGRKLPVKHCLKDTEGWQICPEIEEELEIARSQNIHVEYIDKVTFGSSILRQKIVDLSITHDLVVTFIGVCTDICVISNAIILREAFPNMEMAVIRKATAGVTPEKEEAALIVLDSCQIDVI